MLCVDEKTLRSVVSVAEAIERVEDGFGALARGEVQLPAVLHLDIPDFSGEVHGKGAHVRGSRYFVIKVASGFFDNPSKGLPVGSGLMLVFDATTGRPAALLLDNSWLTDLRTGAAGAVSVRHMAPEKVGKVGVIGSGVAAGFQLRAIREVREIPHVEVWSRTMEHARQFADRMTRELEADVSPVATAQAAVADAQIVLTCTPSREPLVHRVDLAQGTHVVAMGSDGPDKRELASDVLTGADVLIADHLGQCVERGEIHHAVEEGVLLVDDITGSLGDVVLGRFEGRTSDEELTVCDLTGVGVQDAVIGVLALEKAQELGAGRRLDLGQPEPGEPE